MVRYLLQQPRTLESLALKKLGDYIALQGEKLEALLTELRLRDATKAEALLSRQIKVIQSRLDCNVPRMLHDKLLEEIIRAISSYFRDRRNSDTFVMGRMVETMFTKKVTRISLSYQDQILNSVCSKSYMLTGLIELSLFNLKFSEAELIQLLRELHNLKILSFQHCLYYCSEAILRCIVDNCKFIEDLDLSTSHVNDNGIEILTQLCNLKRIDLRYTDVTQAGVKTLITCCKNIDHIFDSRLIASALQQIASLKENAGKHFNLKSFDNARNTVLQPNQLQFIIQLCPLIQNINFDCGPPDSGCNPDFHYREPLYYPYSLKVLNDLHDLRHLKLNHYSFYRHHLNEVLELRGQNLVKLDLQVYEMDINALTCLVQTCPNLENLYINFLFYYEEKNLGTKFKNVFERTRSFAKNLYSKENKKQKTIPHMTKLRFLSVDIEPTHEKLLIFLLASCLNVEFISTGYSVTLTDDIMLQVLDKNPLSRLKELKMWYSNLSMLSIDRIIQNCNKPPIVALHV